MNTLYEAFIFALLITTSICTFCIVSIWNTRRIEGIKDCLIFAVSLFLCLFSIIYTVFRFFHLLDIITKSIR